MKVLQIINSLGTGGAEKLLLDSIPLYRKAGVEMDLLVFWDHDLPFLKELERQHCCKIYVLSKSSNFRSIYNPMHILRMRRIMQQYDIAHVHLFPAQYYAVFANLLNGFLNKRKIPLVFTEHSTSNRRIVNKKYQWIEKLIYKHYSYQICISENVKKVYENYLGKDFRQEVIRNGIDVKQYQYALPSDKIKRDPGDFLLIQVSGFREMKDQATLIRSLPFLPSNVKLLLVGDGPLRQENENLVRKLQLQTRVSFLGNRPDIPNLLKNADIVVLSSRYEGFGLAIVEGMAAGKPAVASDVGGLHEIVKDYGLLFPQGDAKALAAQVIKLYEDNGFYRQIAEQCLERAQEFDINKMIEQYMTMYNILLQKL